MKQIIETMQQALQEVVKQDEADYDRLDEVTNSYNEGWQAGMAQAILTLRGLANQYVINNLEDK